MPDRPSFAKALVTFRPPLMSWRTTLFLVAPVWFGLIFFTAIGQPIHGLLVALGAYIVLIGGGMPWKPRLRAYVIAAVGLVVSVVVGMMNADSLLHTWEAYLAVALVAVVASLWLDPGPPGPYFFVLMVGGGLLLGPARRRGVDDGGLSQPWSSARHDHGNSGCAHRASTRASARDAARCSLADVRANCCGYQYLHGSQRAARGYASVLGSARCGPHSVLSGGSADA